MKRIASHLPSSISSQVIAWMYPATDPLAISMLTDPRHRPVNEVEGVLGAGDPDEERLSFVHSRLLSRSSAGACGGASRV